MASSGTLDTNSVGDLGGSPNRFRISWSVDGQSISGNYTDINWNIRGWGGTSGYWTYKYGSSVVIEGSTVHSSGSQVQMFQNTVFASGTKRVNHNSDGTCTLNISSSGKVYANATNTSGSGSWALPTIPRQATLTSAPNFTDEQNPAIGYSNPAGNSVSTLQARIATTGGTTVVPYRNISKTGSSYTFTLTTEERDDLRALTPNSKTISVRFYVRTVISGDTYDSYSTKTLTIVNGEPTFSTFTHRDANSATEAITGDDQYYIQGHSEVEVTILGADKAEAIKSATMDRYNLAVSSLSEDVDWETSDDIVENIGVLNANDTVPLIVTAIDSRGFTRPIVQNLNVLPYIAPQLTATAQRDNNFETTTGVHIEGVISPLTISGDDKNDVNSTSGVQYRYKKTTDVSWGSWTNKASSLSGASLSVTDFDLSLDRNFAWNLEIKVTDLLQTTTVALLVPVGIPLFRIGLDGGIYNNEKLMATEGETEYFTSNGTWTKPEFLKYVIVEVVGGGGGGRGAVASNPARTANGGGGGGYAKKKIMADDLGSTETVTVGAGGAGGASGDNAGSAGGNSSFGSHAVATGAGASSDDRQGGAGGIGTVGDFLLSGGRGGHYSSGASTGYGGSSFYAPIKSPPRGGGASTAGEAGYAYGGGGTGAWGNSSSAGGGAGASGIVIVHEYY